MHLKTVAALAVVVPLAGCHVSVDEYEHEQKADVRIITPVGNLSVQTGVELPETGLAVYPGARLRHDDRHDAGTADVVVGNTFFGVKIAAAKFESEAPPQAILDYYRQEMQAYGGVTECRGNIDFKRSRQPVCRSRVFAQTTELAVGTEEQHRLVSVKPRGTGSEFSLVYVQTRGAS